ncbi:MAG: hypothetical protein MUO77_16215 [Anaerolineales bacterium]|nr:hypothetical protein [Anaerolineales bacterium]
MNGKFKLVSEWTEDVFFKFSRNDADLFVVERAGHFLAVTGYERDGVIFV